MNARRRKSLLKLTLGFDGEDVEPLIPPCSRAQDWWRKKLKKVSILIRTTPIRLGVMRKSENPLLIAFHLCFYIIRHQPTERATHHDQPATSPFHLHQRAGKSVVEARVIQAKMFRWRRRKLRKANKRIISTFSPRRFRTLDLPNCLRWWFDSHQQHRNQGTLNVFLYPCGSTIESQVESLPFRKHFPFFSFIRRRRQSDLSFAQAFINFTRILICAFFISGDYHWKIDENTRIIFQMAANWFVEKEKKRFSTTRRISNVQSTFFTSERA